MPLWPYGTSTRVGAPATVNITAEEIEVFYATLPLAWAAPVLGLWEPVTLNVDDMCAVEPPPDEQWNVNDIVRSLQPATQAFERAKLRRMAIAAIWPTYCEFNPPPTEVGDTEAIPLLDALHGGAVDGASFFPTHLVIENYEEADFWVFAVQCVVEPVSGGPALLAGGWEDPTEPILFLLPATEGQIMVRTVAKGDLFPDRVDGSTFVPWHATDGWWTVLAAESGGSWQLSISSWRIGPRRPPVPLPWPEAPEDPVAAIFQFTDEEAAEIVLQAEGWPSHLLATQVIEGQLNVVVSEARDNFAALLAAIQGLGVAPFGGFEDGGSNTTVSGNGSFSIPAGVVGFYVFIEETNGATVLGESPEAFFGVGHVAQAWGEVWWASEPIKHNPQVFFPLHQGAQSIWFDLHPSTVLSFNWLVPTTP